LSLQIRKVMSIYRLERFRRALASRQWSGFYDAVIELQRALPESDHPDVVALKEHLAGARWRAAALMQ
jgi:hypothetical protein